ncbi:Cation channel sperm-associated protein 1 like protein, partial [Aduncisulcus paluster]
RASLSGSFGGSDLEATEKETADVTQRLEDTKAKITGEAAGITGPETPSKAAKKKMSIHDVEKEAEKELRKKEKLASSLGGTSSVSGALRVLGLKSRAEDLHGDNIYFRDADFFYGSHHIGARNRELYGQVWLLLDSLECEDELLQEQEKLLADLIDFSVTKLPE